MNSYNECKAIVELDLDPIKFKLMHKKSGEGWTLEQASAVETEYRRFLYMMKAFPNDMLAPSEDIDTFWHYHILDTMKYAQDCEEVFGYFLHHFPYVGMRGEEDLAALGQAGDRMAALYEQTFGEKYQWCLISDAMGAPAGNGLASGPEACPTYCMTPNAAPAYCMTPKTTAAYCMTPKAKAAYCMTPKATAAYCMAPKATAAYCMTPKATAAYCMTPKATAAYCMTPKAKAAYCMTTTGREDETGFFTRPGSTAFSMDLAETVADDGILMNAFFSTRPRLPAQAEAN